jgi:tetratricopeptide (TPR) repeat protein
MKEISPKILRPPPLVLREDTPTASSRPVGGGTEVFDAYRYWCILRKHMWVIVVAFFGAIAAGGVYILVKPPLYAAALFRLGREEEALQEISKSVFYAPSPATHRYLNFDLIPWLSEREQQAVEEGFQRAIALGDAQAFGGLGHFYTALKRFSDNGALYEAAARQQTQVETQAAHLTQAALAYLQAGNDQLGEGLLRQAVTLMPDESQPYQYLIGRVFAVRRDLDEAKAVTADGIRNGADPFVLSVALAEMARGIGAYESARKALQYATNLRPSAFEAHLRLGQVYIQEKNFDRAALALQKALEIDPGSAHAFYTLGIAEEGRYKFFPAKEAYARAIELEPDTTAFQDHYDRLSQKIGLEVR